ncbi:hypothetical protein PBAC_29390 [Pedobacter glucosidilyticus]|nr:hypothetical protein [Pedobacter glucosidilyticus]KHJ36903.1 hypothetical protein PBAC_29390 [Pedobacter glucosidilyticus]
MFTYLKQLLIVVFLTASTQVFSQIAEGYNQATLTFVDGTIKEGFIKDIELMKIDKNIRFKKNLSDKNYQSIKPDSLIKSIVLLNGEKYETLEVKHPLTKESVNIFCALVAKGNLSLYEAKYKGTEFFVLEKDGKTYWLQKDELLDGDSKITKYRFKNILYSAISDSKISEYDVEFVEFNRPSILNLIKRYNSEKGSNTDVIQIIKKPVLFLISGGGIGYQISQNKEWFAESKVRMFFPSMSKSFSLNTGVRYHNLDFEISDNLGTFRNYNYFLGTSLIEVPLELQNNFLSGRFRPFGTLGASLSYLSIDFSRLPQNLNYENTKRQSLAIMGDKEGLAASIIYSLGVEWNLLDNFMLKGLYLQNRNGESILFGLYYSLKLTK